MRNTSDKLLEMVEAGELDAYQVLLAILKYMSEDDVADIAKVNEFIIKEDDEDPSENFDNIIDRDPDIEYIEALRIKNI